MITQLSAKNFKSWKDTGEVRMAPLTAFFGTNSSGKTALLQVLLLLKQTVESADRSRVLHTGDDRTYVDVGTFQDIVFDHRSPGQITLSVGWDCPEPLSIKDPENPKQELFKVKDLRLEISIEGTADSIAVREFAYHFDGNTFGMTRRAETDEYDLVAEIAKQGYQLRRSQLLALFGYLSY